MLRSVLLRAMLLSAVLLALSANVQATDVVLTHQGRLLDASDAPITGAVDITFRVFDVPTGGVPLWMELHLAVAVTDGLFSTTLGSITPMSSDVLASVSSTQPRWLEVEISGAPILPRLLLGSTPSSAVSTRVLGDIQTEPGVLTVSNAVGTKGVVTRASDTNNGIAIEEEGVQRFVVNSHTGPGESHVKMEVGDLTSDGRLDLVVSGDSVVNRWVQDDTPDGEKLVVLRVTPTDNKMELQHGGSTTLTLGTASSDASVQASSGSGGGGGGGSIGTMEMRATPDSAVSILASNGSGPLGTASARFTAVATFEDRSSSDMTYDADGNGIPESSVQQESRPGGATMKAIQTKGTGAIASVRISASDSAGILAVSDLDGDGNPESSMRGLVSGLSPGTTNISATYLDVDDNDDGNPESSVELESRPGGTTMKAIQTKGTGAIALTRMDANDSGSVVIEHDSDGDGVAQTHVGCTAQADVGYTQMVHNTGSSSSTYLGSCDATGTRSIRNSRGTVGPADTREARIVFSGEYSDGSTADLTYDVDDDGMPETGVSVQAKDQFGNVRVSADPDGDGVTDHFVSMDGLHFGTSVSMVSLGGLPPTPTDSAEIEMETSSSSSKMAIKTKGTGAQRSQLTATATMADGCDLALTNDSDADGTSNTTITVRAQDAYGNMVLSSDSDDDGVSDFSSEARCDPVSVRYSLLDTTGDPASVDFIVGNDDPSIAISQEGVKRCLVHPDSGIQLSNSSAVKTVDIHESGAIYISSNMEIGMTGGTHHIDVVGGAYCDGTDWVNASDRNTKENFEKVDGQEILEQIANLEISKWSYRDDKSKEHIGPTAQDFQKAFGVGSDGKSISTIDPAGIALAAIKELYSQLKSKDMEMDQLRKELASLRKELKKK